MLPDIFIYFVITNKLSEFTKNHGPFSCYWQSIDFTEFHFCYLLFSIRHDILLVSEFRTYVTLAYKARKETEVFIVAEAFQEGKLGCYLDFPWKEGVVG